LGEQERRGREDIKEASWGKEIQEGEIVKMAYKIKQEKTKEKISINPFAEKQEAINEDEIFEEELKRSEDGIQN
jgi:hypothetical protein